MVEKGIEINMDDFSVFGASFDGCLANLERILKRCEESNLISNWEKCYFMVTEGIVLGHKISRHGIEVDRAKISTMENLPPPVSVKGVCSFLGHARFYRRFIKDFSNILKPLSTLLMNGVVFDFYAERVRAFNTLKEKLAFASIVVPPNWELPFELMSDASDYIVGASVTNLVVDHLSRLEKVEEPNEKEEQIDENFPDEQLFSIESEESYHVIRRCVPEEEITSIVTHCHTLHCGGHFGGTRITSKVFQCGFYWPTLFKVASAFVKSYDHCQRTGNLSRRDQMPMTGILEVELFNVWGIDFVEPLLSSKWVEAAATPTCYSKEVLKFLHKNIFTQFGTQRAIISDRGSHFCNKSFTALCARYGVHHRKAFFYHPLANGQA
ncbi:uncharacterized protein LOC133814578 [Humulus lupulus]|uniref:uncharacterized protein LOC133814578 n=1 Tax=Humulus lupulus TaxID=3486 RepID=UPI002B40D261|nr:uncharacterized protein LOC133814578 [Humulus lupulus]